MKAIQRTDSLKHTKTLADGKTQEVYAASPGGLRKIQCPRCHANNAVPSKGNNGQTVYRCTCGAQFTSTKM